MALKIIKALKKNVSVKDLIHRRLPRMEPARDHAPLHASDLMKDLEFCPREHAFMDMGIGMKKAEFIGTALSITFGHGRDVERHLRDEWLRDLAVGHWKCGVCSTIHGTFGKAPTIKCPTCGWGHQWEYTEPRFTSLKSGIGGGFDVLLDTGEAKLRVVEVKTIDKDSFKDLKAPLAEHKFRTNLYLRLVAESPLPEASRVNTNEAHVIYVSKSFGFQDKTMKEKGIKDAPFSPIKEFLITRDDEMTSIPYNKAVALHTYRSNTLKGMPCQICTNGLTKRAQKCPSVGSCFSGSYPATLTWLENGKPKHPGKIICN